MKDFFKEKNGQSSSTRLIFFVGSFWVMFLTTYLAFNKVGTGELVALYSALMGVLVGLKLGQKPMEKK